MAGMKPPIVPDQPVPIVPEDGLRRLLAACAGKDFGVASWPTTSDLGLTDGTRQMLEDLLRLGDQLTEDPERASPGQVATQSWPSRHSEADGQGSTREPASMSGADHVRLRERLDQAAQRCNRARPGYPPALFNLHATGTGSARQPDPLHHPRPCGTSPSILSPTDGPRLSQGCVLTPLYNRRSEAYRRHWNHKEAAQTHCSDSGGEAPARPHPPNDASDGLARETQ